MLSVRGLDAGYGRSQVLSGVDLDVAPGEIVALLGRNGMGKTTLLHAILQLLPPWAGSVQFLGEPVTGVPAHRLARRGIALVPEGRQVFPNLTVEEHLTVFARPGRWTPQALYDLFPRLAERRGHLGDQLSGGEQQMLAMARALATNPRLLVLDEATEGLAPLVREEIWRVLAVLRAEGHAMLVVDKYVHRLVGLADRHVVLEKGRVAWTGTSAALSADRGLWSRYLGL
ncbi:ABC transporter ATP-binding protein [Ramlibacter sp. USB13]|uniref:ABC transporter ATP-binding protein n=1 Tax=Ramlibacter cellulosilyticus TaxID=2764187 RepID=A0A923MX37_9BURK|nr:ABC transporter ATP-binding protein [Ramlibacter cellulosilyticus]MBC5785317.1 ABC transporter ATP-binding protein [Ramlibacter cellulosilyticus]